MNVTTILNMFVPFLFFVSLNTLMVFATKKDFGKCIPLTLMSCGFVMYFSQMIFNTFNVGLYLLIGAAIISLIIYRGEKRSISDTLNGYGFIAFAVIYLLILLFDFERRFVSWDELGHWGMMVKEMLRLDKFYCVDECNMLRHRDYPPFISCFQLLWCKITGGYSEMGVTMSIHLLEFSLLIPCLFQKEKKDKWINHIFYAFVFTILSALMLGAIDYEFVFQTISTDILINILYVYSMSLIINKEAIYTKFGFICLIFAQTAVILTKQMGLSYVMIISSFYLITILSEFRFEKHGLKLKNLIASVFLAFIVPVMNMLVWKTYIKRYHFPGQFDFGKISIAEFWGIVSGSGGTDLQRDTLINYCRRILTGSFSNVIPWLSMPVLTVILIFILVLIYRYNIPYIKKYEAVEIGITFVYGTLGMILLMAVLYMFCFNPLEMQTLVSLERYLGTYVAGEFLILLYLVVYLFEKRQMRLSDLDPSRMLICFGG